MHPDDVAEYVAEEVAALRTRLAPRGDLGVRRTELDDALDLRIGFIKQDRPLMQGVVPSGLLGPGGGGIQFGFEVPDLGAKPAERELILRLGCEDFDGEPPTAELLQADGSPLPDQEWPREMGNGGIIRGHPIYRDRPFFCRPGLREFHTHPQHEDQPWDRFRESLPLHQIVLSLLDDLRKRWTLR